jgi:hypothetical protein
MSGLPTTLPEVNVTAPALPVPAQAVIYGAGVMTARNWLHCDQLGEDQERRLAALDSRVVA